MATGREMTATGFRRTVSYLTWPILLVSAVVLTGLGIASGDGVFWFNFIYLGFAAAIGILERVMPHEQSWLKNDHQTFANLAHTVLNKGLVQVLVVVSGTVGLAALIEPETGVTAGLWPSAAPMIVQVILGLAIAELGLYWAHRLAHEVPLLWRFHAVHHSVTRLWFINTGRFHFVDTFWSILLSQPLLYLAGAPVAVFLWVSAVTAFIGMLTHCNVEMRFGPINYIFNTPGLHRWHHSMDIREGNKNYGENLMVWDMIFGTFFNPPRRPPAVIGIDGPMPADFLGQLATPFRRQAGEIKMPENVAAEKIARDHGRSEA